MALDAANEAKTVLAEVMEQKRPMMRSVASFRKLLSAGDKRIPLSEIMDYIDKIVVDAGKKNMVKWS